MPTNGIKTPPRRRPSLPVLTAQMLNLGTMASIEFTYLDGSTVTLKKRTLQKLLAEQQTMIEEAFTEVQTVATSSAIDHVLKNHSGSDA